METLGDHELNKLVKEFTTIRKPAGCDKIYKKITNKKKAPRIHTNEELRSREYLTEDEVMLLRKAVRNKSQYKDRDEAIILLGYRHGLRLSELANLKWDQFDLKNCVMHVKRAKHGVPSTHPISGEELRLLRKIQRSEHKGKHLFISRNRLPIAIRTLNTIIKNAGKWAGLDFPIHPHMLRHGCGYYLANKGIDTRSIQLYMGHKNIQNTVIYTQLDAGRFNGFWED